MRELEIALFAFVQSFVSLSYFLYRDHRLQILCRLQEVHVVVFAFKFEKVQLLFHKALIFAPVKKQKRKSCCLEVGLEALEIYSDLCVNI